MGRAAPVHPNRAAAAVDETKPRGGSTGRRPEVATIGVYGWTLDAFLGALRAANVRQLVDIRQRRGVRGSEYAWANARRLEATLADAGIEYRHEQALAPTTRLRQVQYAEDDRLGVGKRSRTVLAAEYRDRYLGEILDGAELAPIVEQLPRRARGALLCVERDPEACHRSLVAERLVRDFGATVVHLRP